MRLLAVLLLSSLPALAKPSFNDVAKKFPELSLPLTLKEPLELKQKLTPQDLAALGLAGQELLGDLNVPASKKEKRALWAVGRLARATFTLYLLCVDRELAPATSRRMVLFSLGAKNELVGAAELLVEATDEARVRSGITTLDAAGGIARSLKDVRKTSELGLPAELAVTSEQRVRVTSSGAFEVSPTTWTARTGAYVDERSGEELRVEVRRVFFRARVGEAFVEMTGDGNTMRLGADQRPWVLTWNDRRSEISVQNPAGEVQRFVRAW